MFSTLPSIALIVAAIVATLRLAGMYGVALAAVGMLSTLGVTLAADAYGPVVDNAGGIAEMADMPPEVRFSLSLFAKCSNGTHPSACSPWRPMRTDPWWTMPAALRRPACRRRWGMF